MPRMTKSAIQARVFLAAFVLLLSGVAQAQAQAQDKGARRFEGFNAGGSLAATKMLGESATALGGHIGYDFSRDFGIEAQYQRLGTIEFVDDRSGATLANIRVNAISVSAVGRLPFGAKTDVYGRAGLVHLAAGTSGSAFKVGETLGNKFMLGIGIRHYVTDSVDITAEFVRYARDLKGFRLAASYHF